MHQTVEQIYGNGLIQIHKNGYTLDTEKCLWSECLNNFIYTHVINHVYGPLRVVPCFFFCLSLIMWFLRASHIASLRLGRPTTTAGIIEVIINACYNKVHFNSVSHLFLLRLNSQNCKLLELHCGTPTKKIHEP
jgi:hypothetical protein